MRRGALHYSVAPRRRVGLAAGVLGADLGRLSLLTERNRVSCPNPLLAREVTWRRISSIDREDSSLDAG